MIIKTRRKNESIIKRLFKNTVSRHGKMPIAHVLPQEMFEAELVKEAFRSNRRRTDREFALVTFDFCDKQATDQKLASLIAEFRSRLRVSDIVGWLDLKLAVLLPETKKSGAILVANQLTSLSQEQGIKVDMHVAIYPWDDTLVAVTDELKAEYDHSDHQSHDDKNDDDQDYNGGSQNGQHERVDSAHEIAGHNHFESTGDFNGGSGAVAVDVRQPKTIVKPKVLKEATVSKAVLGTGNNIQILNDKTPKWKRAIDIVGAGTGLLMLTPLFACTAIAIKCSSRGPVIQTRKLSKTRCEHRASKTDLHLNLRTIRA